MDDNFFNSNDEISEYKFDDYNDDQDFILDESYKIPKNLIHLFTLESKTPTETSPTTIYAVYIGDISNIKNDTVIMYCHGNKWHMDYYWQRAKLLAHCGGKNNYGLLMIDYRGYGLSDGKSTEESLYADIDAGLNWMKSNGLTNDRLVMYGYSMGTGPATFLTANPRSMSPFKLILEAPYASVEVMVQDASVLNVPGSFVTSLKIENAEEIKKISQPFMWMHGTKDLFLNIETHGQVVYDNYKGIYKESHKIENADHGEIQILMGFNSYLSKVESFIKRN